MVSLPLSLLDYLATRERQRANAITGVLTTLTLRERALLHDAAVAGYVRGMMAADGEEIPKDGAIIAEVVDTCLAHPDLYPMIAIVAFEADKDGED